MVDDNYHQQLRARQAEQARLEREEADRRAAQEEQQRQRRLADAERSRRDGPQRDNAAGL